MKLIRWRDAYRSYPGIFINNNYFDLSSFTDDFNESFFSSNGINALREYVQEYFEELKKLPEDIILDSPIARPSKIICLGLNYADHAKEINTQPRAEPVLFLKSTTALCGPFDNIIVPKGAEKTDWEVELAFVIGKKASYVLEENALDYIAGYCLHNDVSERAFQMERGGTWDKGKGCDSFAPVGPWLVTPEELDNVNNLRLWLKVNDKLMQDSNTSNLIFKIPYIIAYLSCFMTLLPGDIISTGTPAGVGMGMRPPLYLKAGDVVELGVDGLGMARQKVVPFESLVPK